MKRIFSWVFGLLLISYLGLVFYANRAAYAYRYDPDYWRDKYENSQWLLPQSKRGIGDDGVYLYQGYRLMQGDDPTLLNAEVPPLGKYAIGASLRLLGNGSLYGFITTTAVLIAFFFLAKLFLPITLALATTLIVALDPLITSQFPLTMLESLQLLFLLLTILLARSGFPFATGLSLGLFSVAKFPLFTPLLAIPILWSLWQKKKLMPFLLFFIGGVIGYLLPYIQYFRLGHTLFDWIGVQKWIISFYRSANLPPSYGSMTTTMLMGKLQNLFTHSWQQVPEWTPTWTALLVLFPVFVIRYWHKHRVVIASLTATIILFNVIPFWTRYLVPLLPLLYLIAVFVLVKFFKRAAPAILVLFLLANAWKTYPILFPTPQATVAQIVYDWQYGLFQELYEHTTDAIKTNTDRNSFHRFGQTLYHDGQIEGATITVINQTWHPWTSPQFITFDVTYHTRNLGNFRQATQVPMVRENGRWRALWEWDNVIAGVDETTHLETTVSLAKRGTITSKTVSAPVARDLESWLVWVTPKDIDKSREEAMLQFLQGLFDKRTAAALIHLRYSQQQPDQAIALGVARAPLEDTTRSELLSYPGLTLTPAWYRWSEGELVDQVGVVDNTLFPECCSFLYNTTAYDGASGWEQQYNEVLKGTNGGSLVLKDSQGNIIRTIIEREKRDGKDVEL